MRLSVAVVRFTTVVRRGHDAAREAIVAAFQRVSINRHVRPVPPEGGWVAVTGRYANTNFPIAGSKPHRRAKMPKSHQDAAVNKVC